MRREIWVMIRVIGSYDSIIPISPNLSPKEIPYLVNYQLPKSNKAYDQGQKIVFFFLNQYPNDHGSINLSQRIKSILRMIN